VTFISLIELTVVQLPRTIPLAAYAFFGLEFPMSMTEDRYAAMSSRELLAECLQSMDVEAWREFVRRCEPVIASSVTRVARQFGRSSPDLVLDLTQDVYFKLCKDGFRLLRDLRITHERALFAYLKLVAMSVAHDHFRKKRPDVNADEFRDDFSGGRARCATRETTEDEKILIQEIEGIVERITAGPNAERDRLVFWLHHREGFATSAIASIAALRLTQKGVESLLYRIRMSLRNELRQIRKDDQFRRRIKVDFSVS